MAATTLENVIVIKSTNGRVYKVDRVSAVVKIYVDEAAYNADTQLGQLPMSEFAEIFEYIRDVSK